MRTVAATALGLSLVIASACGGQTCPGGCPATALGAGVAVTTTPAMAVAGVNATVSGPVTATLVCQPNLSSSISCFWPLDVPIKAGNYSLQVSAPGYETTTFQVEIIIPAPVCGCSLASFQPDIVMISPVAAG